MTEIDCVKCRKATKTKSEQRLTTKNGRNRLAGICSTCGSKKNMFVGGNWKVTKSPEELDKASEDRVLARELKRATKIGIKVIENKAEDCINECIAQMRKQKK